MNGLEIAKAGWLHRLSSVLRRWKKNWFVLYRDGILRYFESPESHRAEEIFILRQVCKRIKCGPEVSSHDPPDGVSSGRSCMFELEMNDGTSIVLCAETFDDMKAWQIALEEARTMQPSPTEHMRNVPIHYHANSYPYGGYPGQIISPSPYGPYPVTQVMRTPDGHTTYITNPSTQVIYVDDYPYGRRGDFGYGAGAGFLTGALVGSTLMWPFFLW